MEPSLADPPETAVVVGKHLTLAAHGGALSASSRPLLRCVDDAVSTDELRRATCQGDLHVPGRGLALDRCHDVLHKVTEGAYPRDPNALAERRLTIVVSCFVLR